MSSTATRRRLLLVGGSGGLVGRAVLPEFLPEWTVRSVHRHRVEAESAAGVEWVRADAAEVPDWDPLLEGVDTVLNLVWYRWGSESRFRRTYEGLDRLVAGARKQGTRRFLHVSVPPAPEAIESGVPYLAYKRRLDRAIQGSGLSYRIVRPTMLFGPRDVLLTVMLREIRRYPFFPMFGDGRYHVSPVAVEDLARVLRLEAEGSLVGTVDVGGPRRYEYRELTDEIFRAVGKRPRYWSMSTGASRRLAGLLQFLGSELLYRYEVEWLMSDMLGLPAFSGLDRPMATVEPFLDRQAELLRTRAPRPS